MLTPYHYPPSPPRTTQSLFNNDNDDQTSLFNNNNKNAAHLCMKTSGIHHIKSLLQENKVFIDDNQKKRFHEWLGDDLADASSKIEQASDAIQKGRLLELLSSKGIICLNGPPYLPPPLPQIPHVVNQSDSSRSSTQDQKEEQDLTNPNFHTISTGQQQINKSLFSQMQSQFAWRQLKPNQSSVTIHFCNSNVYFLQGLIHLFLSLYILKVN